MSSKRNESLVDLSQHNLNQEDVKKMISDTVFYFLVADQKKSIIKRGDVVKHCQLKNKNAVVDLVMAKAIETLSKTFGLQVHELIDRKGNYIILNLIKETDGEFLEWSEKENGQLALTYTILAVIFMSNGKVTDDVLFKFLRSLGLFEDEKNKRERGPIIDPEVAELFDGDIKKFVNDVLVGRQHYLRRERVQSADAELEAYEYSWGERAEVEVKRSAVLKMVCEVYNCSYKMFREQLEQVKKEEGATAMEEEEEEEEEEEVREDAEDMDE